MITQYWKLYIARAIDLNPSFACIATYISIHRSLKSISIQLLEVERSNTCIHLNPLLGSIHIVIYKLFKSMTAGETVPAFARGIDLNPSLAIDDRCHASQHASASVGRSPTRETLYFSATGINIFVLLSANKRGIDFEEARSNFAWTEGGGGGGRGKNQTA